jgi:hypothetical protein
MTSFKTHPKHIQPVLFLYQEARSFSDTLPHPSWLRSFLHRSCDGKSGCPANAKILSPSTQQKSTLIAEA